MSEIAAGLQSRGIDAIQAQSQALGIINQTVNTQSAILSFEDIFWLVGVAFLVSLPLLLLLGKKRPDVVPSAH